MKTRVSVAFALFTLFNSFAAVAQTWQQYSDSAKLFAANKEASKAIIYYSLAKDVVRKDSVNSATYVQLSRSLAAIHYSESQFKKAAALFEEAKEISLRMYGKEVRYTSILNSLAAAYNRAGEYKMAEGYYLEAREIRLSLLGL